MGRYFSKRALKKRMGEGSTWAGLAIVASVIGSAVGMPPEAVQALIAFGGAVAVGLPEGSVE